MAVGKVARVLVVGAGVMLAAFASMSSIASTIWSGPPITFTKNDNTDPTLAANQDQLTANVWLTRGQGMGLFNIVKEKSYDKASGTSAITPSDTEWAFGTTANLTGLKFKPWVVWNNQNPPDTVKVNAVLHLITDDIYIDIQFLSWEQGGGGFSYTRSTPAAGPPSEGVAVEFYHPQFDHYFITADAAEAANLAAGNLPPWVPTGLTFPVWSAAGTNITNVWRFFSASFAPLSGHFYTNNPTEAAGLIAGNVWTLEETNAFYMMASPDGTCASGSKPLYRLYNNGMGGAPNHRYTIDSPTRTTMIGAGWIPEGNGPDGVFACVPQS